MSTTRSRRAYSTKQKMGTNGRAACLQCEGDITDKQRSTFCRKECSDAFYIKSRPDHARLRVFERDKGICQKCGKDVFEGTGRKPRARGTGDLWQADHIVPVVEGGGECTLENLRTLCTACHKEETAALAKRRAGEKTTAKSSVVYGGNQVTEGAPIPEDLRLLYESVRFADMHWAETTVRLIERIARLSAENRELAAKVERLKAPVSEREWADAQTMARSIYLSDAERASQIIADRAYDAARAEPRGDK